ncbi:class I adenylate-forming enzyme family protein [Streptomyces sp. NPDC058304]|uniref:class I adenylate-forming enzyme family protein n=1 Tax=Streptomyces sp. NPDC058304 TaxID=3346437 RepID=UPI0036E54CE9
MTGRSTTQGHYVTRMFDVLARAPRQARIQGRAGALDGAALVRSVHRAHDALRAAGAGPGAMVGILTGPNHPLTFTARHAAHLLGAGVMYVRSVNPGSDLPLPPAEQAALLAECDVTVLVVDPAHAERGAELARLLPQSPAVTVLDIDIETEAGSDTPAALTPRAPDCALVTYTSGSSGRPKGVRQSFTAWNRLVLLDAASLAGRPPERMLIVTPTSHTVAVMADVVLASGGSLVVHERFDAAEVLAALAAERITRVYLTVPQLYRLLDHPDAAGTDLSGLRQLIYSGCVASPARLASAVRVFGPRLVQCYGSTEAGRITLLDQLDHFEEELLPSVGRPFPGVEVRVCDPDTGREVPSGATGEVQVRSPYAMSGYQGLPAESAAALLPDGWLRTGDLGHWDAYGYLHLVDRIGRVVKAAGVKVRPAEVERALLTHPAVADCAVFGMPDPDTGEAVHAAVVLRVPCEPDALRRHVTEALSAAHAPTRIVRWPELPLTESGKPDLRRLRGAAVAGAASTLEESELSS